MLVTESRILMEKLRNRDDVSPRMFAVFMHRIHNPGYSFDKSVEFVDKNMVDVTPNGDPIWNNPDSAAKYCGGIRAVDFRVQPIYDKPVRRVSTGAFRSSLEEDGDDEHVHPDFKPKEDFAIETFKLEPKDARIIQSEVYSVLRNLPDDGSGGPRGGIGGGIKSWHRKDDRTGRLTEEIVGYVNF